MGSREFCIWLAGWLEAGRALGRAEAAAVRARLSQVFTHEIDPAFGDEAHLARLRLIHCPADDQGAD